tara:strand:- start:6081 stop:6776 length:696 start_codon:yes stop_codon:yes gene_type:complete
MTNSDYKVLVLGSGLIGSEVTKVCNDLGYTHTSVDINNGIHKIDLTKIDSLNELLNSFKPNVVFNTAGIDQKLDRTSKPLHQMPEEEWDYVFTNNTNITKNVAKQVLSYFVKSDLKIKKLIFTPSTYSFVSPNPLFYSNDFIKSFAYVGSKTIEVDIVKYISKHYAKYNILCNALVPHLVMRENKNIDETFVPLKRSCDPKELHPAINLLLDPKNSFMSGEFVKINGAWLA